MLRSLHNLNRRILPNLRREVRWQRHLREADRAVVHLVGRARDTELWLHDQRVVPRYGALAEIDVHQR